MSSKRFVYRIQINVRDPAKAQIAEDLTACGGTPLAGLCLAFGFQSAVQRDKALRAIRSSFGTCSVEPLDPVASGVGAAISSISSE